MFNQKERMLWFAPTNSDPLHPGIMGLLYESAHGLNDNVDCVIGFAENEKYYRVIKLTDIWAD